MVFERQISLFEFPRLKLHLEKLLARKVDLVIPEALQKVGLYPPIFAYLREKLAEIRGGYRFDPASGDCGPLHVWFVPARGGQGTTDVEEYAPGRDQSQRLIS